MLAAVLGHGNDSCAVLCYHPYSLVIINDYVNVSFNSSTPVELSCNEAKKLADILLKMISKIEDRNES